MKEDSHPHPATADVGYSRTVLGHTPGSAPGKAAARISAIQVLVDDFTDNRAPVALLPLTERSAELFRAVEVLLDKSVERGVARIAVAIDACGLPAHNWHSCPAGVGKTGFAMVIAQRGMDPAFDRHEDRSLALPEDYGLFQAVFIPMICYHLAAESSKSCMPSASPQLTGIGGPSCARFSSTSVCGLHSSAPHPPIP